MRGKKFPLSLLLPEIDKILSEVFVKTLIFYISILFSLLFSSNIFALVYEVGFDFGYDKQIYGTNRNNSIITRSYSGGLSIYLFEYTAIDLNASMSKDITTNTDSYVITGSGYEKISQQDRVETDVYGVGIKQMLAPKTAFIVPMISAGYARETVYSDFDSTYKKTSDGSSFTYNSEKTKSRYNSVYGTFMLQFHLTQALSLKGSVKTLFPAFDFNKAKDNLKYSVGFSWMF